MAGILLTTRCRDSGLYDNFRENAPRNSHCSRQRSRRLRLTLSNSTFERLRLFLRTANRDPEQLSSPLLL